MPPQPTTPLQSTDQTRQPNPATETSAYPIITDVDEGETKCFNFNVPEDDDAHMVFMVLPDESADE
eukprot:scaffold196755_cov43-Cyclotella_meneghiniana.AAC.1